MPLPPSPHTHTRLCVHAYINKPKITSCRYSPVTQYITINSCSLCISAVAVVLCGTGPNNIRVYLYYIILYCFYYTTLVMRVGHYIISNQIDFCFYNRAHVCNFDMGFASSLSIVTCHSSVTRVHVRIEQCINILL